MKFEKKWERKFEEVPEDFLNEFREYPNFLKQILWLRGLRTEEEIKKFLEPSWERDLHPPYLLSNIEKAGKRIIEAIKRGEKIIIFGDFDADGVTGSALLNNFLKRMNYSNFEVFLPHRNEGYGLSEKMIKRFSERKAKLVITNDCGITDVEEVKLANEKGIDVIVTDHHLPQKELPPAFALVNPNLPGDKYPFKKISGAGVVFKLIQEILDLGKIPFKEGFEKWSSNLLAISTVADYMPLIDENRAFVKFGLVALEKTKEVGLLSLKKITGLEEKRISSKDIAFIIAPLLNSASRIDHANTAFEILTTESEMEADWLAKKLNETNKERQRQVQEAYQQALEKLKKPIGKVVALGSPAWTPGIVSNLSSRLKEEFSRPVFLWQEKLLEFKGSARSIESFNLVEAMEKIAKRHSEFFISFGGHAMAAGFTIRPQYAESFLKELNKLAEEKIKPEDLIPKIEIEGKLGIEDFDKDFFSFYSLLEPFGVKNEEPSFLIEKAKVINVSSVGNNSQHLKLKIDWNGRIFDALGFGGGKDCQEIFPDDYLDLVVKIRENEWQGEKKIDFQIIDWRKR